MSQSFSFPHISDDEYLARFILRSNHVRADNSVRPDAFIPFPWPDLSVTRHRDLDPEELWEIGRAVAAERPATLYGRADIEASFVLKQSLTLNPTETPKNHVNIGGWPADKPAQKIVAQELAAEAIFVPKPNLAD